MIIKISLKTANHALSDVYTLLGRSAASGLVEGPVTYEDISGVGDGSDDSGGNHKLLPGLGEVKDVHTLVVSLVNVGSHGAGAVLSAEVDLHTGIR